MQSLSSFFCFPTCLKKIEPELRQDLEKWAKQLRSLQRFNAGFRMSHV